MRTLKKTLALVLVLAMMFSLCAVSASADFTDDAEIKYTEAVEVLTAIGVIDGMGDGSFAPNGTLTRAQAAKIIVYLLGAEGLASAAVASFDDVAADHWAADFIAYCAEEGIVSGYGDGNFGPEDVLTGYQWAKMLLVALGFDADEYELGGTAWQINTAKLANKVNLFAGNLKGDKTVAATREEACLYGFNALFIGEEVETTAVKYITTNAGVNTIHDTYAAAQAALAVTGTSYAGSMEVTTTVVKGSLADTVHAVRESAIEADAFGRPATVYEQYNGKAYLPIVSLNDAPVMSSTSAISAAELYNTLGYNAVIKAAGSSYSWTTTAKGGVWTPLDSSNQPGAITSDYAVSAKSTAIGCPGIITEIYKADDKATADVEYIVVQIRPTLAKVGAPVKHAATATEGAKTTWSVAGLTLVDYTSVVNAVNDVDNFNTEVALQKDAYVLVYGNAVAGYTVAPATLVEGKVTGYASKTNAWTIGEASYPESGAAIYGSVATPISATTTTPATYAVDTYGNVIGSVSVFVPANFAYVVAEKEVDILDPETNVVTNDVIQATIMTTAGELKTVVVSKVGGVAATLSNLEANGGLYTYKLDAKGNYELTADAGSNGGFTVTTVTKNNAALGGSKYANNNTVYYVAQTTKINNVDVITSVTSYTGYTNVASLTSPTAAGIDANADGIAEIVFVMPATEAISAVSYVYLTGSYNIVGTDCIYDAIIKGETTTIKLPAGKTAGMYSIDTAGTVASVTGSAKYMTYNEGVLMTSGTVDGTYAYECTVGAAVPVYTIENGVCTVSTAADLATTGSAAVTIARETVNGVANVVVAIYIVK